jgi:cation diffusion facilitator CzcD-associated flavoprotein CzcO
MPEQTSVIILGAGPSGLATAGCLREKGVPFVVVERAGTVGSTWRSRYERLHLHTIKQFSALPGLPWPSTVPMYPSRDEVVAYLERYAVKFQIEPRFGFDVTSARHDGTQWVVRAGEDEIRARSLVIATGYNRVPKVPSWPGQERFRGAILHSSEYTNGTAWKGKRALVVGIGNSGGEIAIDLWEHGAETAISVRSPVHVVPRDLFGLPAQVNSLFLLGRLPPKIADRIANALLGRVIGDLSRFGLHRPTLGPVSQVIETGRIPLIDVGTIELVKQGRLQIYPGPRELTEDGVLFTDGREFKADVLVLATGFRAALEGFLENAERYVDERGYPRRHGVEAETPGLYFIGYRNPLTGALHDIALEARRVAQALSRS